MTRREVFGLLAALPMLAQDKQDQNKVLRNFGGAPAGFPVRSRAGRGAPGGFDFVGHCHSLGLGVVETRLAGASPEAIRTFRARIDSYGMRAIFDVGYPRDANGVAAFDASVKAAKDCGAVSLHAAMTGRRYEDFDTFEAFKKDFDRCKQSIALAEPVLRKYRIPLGIENHKGWRSAEQAAWLKSVSSEWVGVHFDFGNNLSLCEDPKDTLHNLLPFVFASHIKDMSVEPYEDGFLLSEVPLGEGILDLKGMVATLRGKNPNIPLDLEMITRDPLKIPVYTPKYWVTFDDSYSPLPGRDLAHTLDLVRKNKPRSPLPHTTGMSAEAQLHLEDENVAKSLEYARANLG
ncbi:MAG TPA: sugar phosphate isomerase/epimerase family protein [Bryobacteraceae bacterium]|jgi:sugar phosphate isomerase/epimerase|nr:sugar phosphate isomerase/epimerase family protein [Bryobacteraceae bacterium]